MKIKASEPGVIVSGVAHLALLAMTLVVFSDAKTFEPAQESVPVEILTDQQFNEITKGEKTAKTVKPAPTKADKVAEVEEKKPTPQVEAKVDVPTPPPPLKRIPDPGEDNTPEPPTPPKRVAAGTHAVVQSQHDCSRNRYAKGGDSVPASSWLRDPSLPPRKLRSQAPRFSSAPDIRVHDARKLSYSTQMMMMSAATGM